MFRIRTACPELMELSMQSNLFKLPGDSTVNPDTSDQTGSSGYASDGSGTSLYVNNPRSMAERFQVPYLGKLPMDPNMMKACEEGKSFLEAYPSSVAAAPFAEVVAQIVSMTSDVRA
jgi:hypothetical protein